MKKPQTTKITSAQYTASSKLWNTSGTDQCETVTVNFSYK